MTGKAESHDPAAGEIERVRLAMDVGFLLARHWLKVQSAVPINAVDALGAGADARPHHRWSHITELP